MMQKAIKRRLVDLSHTDFSPDIPSILQRIYSARQIKTPNQLARGLNGLCAPGKLKGITAAVSLLEQALKKKWHILVIGDFDADGATSCALAVSALQAFGAADVKYLVPNRFEYGYGLTPEIVEVAVKYSPDLIITVDNGISSIDGVAAARALGTRVLVTDHHLAGSELPEADVIVNPNQPGCNFPSKNLAGVGVIFYVLMALRGHLRSINWFEQNDLPEPNMANFLDLVALGTVADVVPLDENNRILVYQGLQRIKAGVARPGILALIEVGKRQRHRLVASDLGFVVGPRLNAAGRLDDMSLGINCLLTDDPYLAKEMAEQLDDLNQDRKNIEASMQQEAIKSLDALRVDVAQEQQDELPYGLCLFDDSWHQGVIGILASRIKERYHRPVIAFADVGDGQIKGSARSIEGLHIRDALDSIAARCPGLLTKFGGHAMAAGLSLDKASFPSFCVAYDDEVKRRLSKDDLVADVLTDGVLTKHELTLTTAHIIREAGPWGQGFPEPVFDGEFKVLQQRIVGEKHLKMVVAPADDEQQTLDAIYFNADLDKWPNLDIGVVSIAYRLDVNEFRGQQNLQLMIEYIQAVVEPTQTSQVDETGYDMSILDQTVLQNSELECEIDSS